MTAHDMYNGWTNWETWNTNLWMTNDEDLYHVARRIVAQYIKGADEVLRDMDTYRAGQALAEWWDEACGPDAQLYIGTPLMDVWNEAQNQVNWEEIVEVLTKD